MELTFLGTACMHPTKKRNHVSFILLRKSEGILFDCGEGTQRQLKIAGIKPSAVKKILLSHLHGDHVLGIPGLLQTLASSDLSHTLQIYGPPGTKEFVSNIIQTFKTQEVAEHIVYDVTSGIVCRESEYSIISSELDHGCPCVGYALIENDRRRVKVQAAKEYGLTQGPLLGKLQNGKSVKLNNKLIKPDDVTYIVRGKKIAYIADTRPCDGAYELAKDATLVVSESTYLYDVVDKAEKYKHLTAREAALIASQSNAKKLILTHFSSRYKNENLLEEEARLVFDNSFAASDFLKIRL